MQFNKNFTIHLYFFTHKFRLNLPFLHCPFYVEPSDSGYPYPYPRFTLHNYFTILTILRYMWTIIGKSLYVTTQSVQWSGDSTSIFVSLSPITQINFSSETNNQRIKALSTKEDMRSSCLIMFFYSFIQMLNIFLYHPIKICTILSLS